MRLAVSNIAWDRRDDPRVLAFLRDARVDGVEVAPTKIWPGWEGASEASAREHGKTLAGEGLAVPALQALLFGKPGLRVFDPATHAEFLGHMGLVADLARGLGARVLVFGSPKNRRRGDVPLPRAMEEAAAFFRGAAGVCADRGTVLGLEPNPPGYGCDFATDAAQARELVDRVDHPAFGLHLDAGGIRMAGGDVAETVRTAGPIVHYHVSEPGLAPIAGGEVDHEGGIRALRETGYGGWASIEMREPPSLDVLERSVRRVRGLLDGA